MIDIKDISGKILKSVIETTDCKKYEELMSLCYISLSWDDENNIQLPAGSYIEYNGEKYRLIEPYDPSFKDESTFQYTPKFYDKIALWSKKPLFLVTDTGEETDWSMTAYPGQFMEVVVRALSKYTGETFTYSVDASIAQSTMEYISFQNKNIFDGLTEIANKWDVEWWIEGNIIHLSKCQYGEPITLEVGKNVGIPTVTNNKDGYFTRFYAFGSTKNITQEYDDGGFTNGLVNKRLTLNPSLYPGGYMDIRPDLHPEEVFVKTLIFDNIFPSSKLVISGVRAELKDYIDSDGNKIQVGESEGKPLYKQYAIWYFKIDGFNFNNSTYDKDDNPEGMLLSGLDLSVIFESGQLNGRDFKLTYHEKTQEYEINFVEESGSIIVPGTVSLIPADGDNIVLYNIRMPEEYVSSSQEELAEALLSEMERYKRNMNSYSFPSYPVSFYEENLDMKVGQSVSFIYGGNNLSTRVLKVEKQLDYPIEQTITIGEEKIKGNTQEIKEEVIDANQNIDVVKALADLNKAITDGYGRVQQLIMQSLSQYKGIWTLDQNGFPNDPSKWTIKTDYTAISAKDFIAFADGGEYASGLPVADYDTFGLFKAKQGGGLLFDANEGWYVDPEFAGGGGIDEEQLKQYLTDNNYITVDYLTKQGYLTLSSQLTGYTKPDAYSPIAATDTILSAIGKLERNFDNYVDLTTNQTIGGVKTFNENVLSKKDIIAFADGGEYASGLPVADTVTYGLVKVDGTTVRINALGQLEAGSGGGIDFEVGTGLQMSASSVLSVKYGTTAGTACQGNDTRLHMHNNKSILDGITSGLISNWNTAYTNNHTHNNKTVLDGISSTKVSHWDTAYTNNHTHSNKSYLDVINQGLGTSYSPTFKAITLSEWTIDGTGGDLNLRHFSQLAAYFSGSNNGNFVTKGTMIAEGDVIAYQDGGSYASGLPVADSSTYGLVRYDGTTIGKNSSGQLYVINAGSGGGSNINVIDSLTSQSKTDALSANQGYQLDQRLKNVRWATPDGTDYVRVYLGSEYKDLSKNGHSHSNYMLTSSTSWGTSYTNYASLKINGTSKNVSLNGHTHSNYLESSDIYGLTIYINGSSQGTYNPTSSSKSIYITTGGGGDWNGGTVSNGITMSTSSAVGISIQTGRPFIKFGSYWEIRSGSDLNFYYNGGSAVAYFSGSNRGNLWIAGTLSQNSDMRLKTVLSPITDVLKAISTFNVFRYKYNNDKLGRVRIGMSAQQVKIYYPELVFTESDGYYSMDYVSMSAVLVGGMQELYTRFLPVENKVKILESRVQNLQLRLDNAYREIFELKQQMGGAA